MNQLKLAAVLVALAAGVTGASETAEEKVVFSEAFSSELGKGWSWLREDTEGWRLDQGSLLVQTSTGSLWMKQNNNRNVLLRTPPETESFAFEVLVENEPTNGFEHAGLVWYADDDNYVALMKEKVGKVVVQLVSETGGRPKVGFAEKAYSEKAIWLRMEIVGGKARGLYRTTDKSDWQALGECDIPTAEGKVQIGLMTGYAAGDAKNSSSFSNFRALDESK